MRVITFSTKFPAKHPKAGQETDFVQKIWSSLLELELISLSKCCELSRQTGIGDLNMNNIRKWKPEAKGHTIRAGECWPDGKPREVGDWFKPVIWGNDINPKSGRSGPYQSKQIEFAPPIQIKKIWKIRIEILDGIAFTFWLNDKNLPTDKVVELAQNDGLKVNDFFNWFLIHPKQKTSVFYGQVLCWNESIEYTNTKIFQPKYEANPSL